jgi:RNA polymerase sigma factor (sigma-70 family)
MAESFLSRFDPDPRAAERKCEDLWRRLVFYFQHHLVRSPEDRAQDVFYRILNNLPESATSYEDVVKFSFGVARNVVFEAGRELAPAEPPAEVAAGDPDPEEMTSAKQRAEKIQECLQSLSASDQELIEDWYLEGRKRHSEVAERLSLTPNALRLRVFRIKNRFEECLQKRGLS